MVQKSKRDLFVIIIIFVLVWAFFLLKKKNTNEEATFDVSVNFVAKNSPIQINYDEILVTSCILSVIDITLWVKMLSEFPSKIFSIKTTDSTLYIFDRNERKGSEG